MLKVSGVYIVDALAAGAKNAGPITRQKTGIKHVGVAVVVKRQPVATRRIREGGRLRHGRRLILSCLGTRLPCANGR